MSFIIQDVKITKHVNPSKNVQDEYTMIITFHDIVYVTKITEKDYDSNLFDFDMLENLIYNCNHKQIVGDIRCDMTLKESDYFGKNLDMLLIFERNVKPMKKIYEEHLFQLQEEKLDYCDKYYKIRFAVTNLRNEINFTMIKPTTDIIQIRLAKYKTYYDRFYKVLRININSILKNNYVDSIHIQDISYLIIFIDKTKKSNNRLIRYYQKFKEFIKEREQLKTYHILENHLHGILVEELP